MGGKRSSFVPRSDRSHGTAGKNRIGRRWPGICRYALAVVLPLCVAMGLPDAARAGVQRIQVPGAEETFVTSINNQGQIVGYYTVRDGIDVRARGFIYDGKTFTLASGPTGAVSFIFEGINDFGIVTGYYQKETPSGLFPGGGFIFEQGVYRLLDTSPLGASFIDSRPMDINNRGEIVGSLISSTGAHGFWYDGQSAYVEYDDTSFSRTLTGLNDIGNAVEIWSGPFTAGSYLYPKTPGSAPAGGVGFRDFDWLAYGYEGINNDRDMVGWFDDEISSYRRGVLIDLDRNDQLALGVDRNAVRILPFDYSASPDCDFWAGGTEWWLSTARCGTMLADLNDFGVMVGNFIDNHGNVAFITQRSSTNMPEPPTSLLLLPVLFGLAVLRNTRFSG